MTLCGSGSAPDPAQNLTFGVRPTWRKVTRFARWRNVLAESPDYDSDELVGAAESAARLGVARGVVGDWRRRYRADAVTPFPEPVASLAMGHVWFWPHGRDWARATNRTAERDGGRDNTWSRVPIGGVRLMPKLIGTVTCDSGPDRLGTPPLTRCRAALDPKPSTAHWDRDAPPNPRRTGGRVMAVGADHASSHFESGRQGLGHRRPRAVVTGRRAPLS